MYSCMCWYCIKIQQVARALGIELDHFVRQYRIIERGAAKQKNTQSAKAIS